MKGFSFSSSDRRKTLRLKIGGIFVRFSDIAEEVFEAIDISDAAVSIRPSGYSFIPGERKKIDLFLPEDRFIANIAVTALKVDDKAVIWVFDDLDQDQMSALDELVWGEFRDLISID